MDNLLVANLLDEIARLRNRVHELERVFVHGLAMDLADAEDIYYDTAFEIVEKGPECVNWVINTEFALDDNPEIARLVHAQRVVDQLADTREDRLLALARIYL